MNKKPDAPSPNQPTLPEGKAWVDFTEAEKALFKPHIVGVAWKDEGRSGPVWVEFDIQVYDTFWKQWGNASINYQNSPTKILGEERYYAQWFTYTRAERIAQELGTKFNP